MKNGLPMKYTPSRPMITPALFLNQPPDPIQASLSVRRRTAAVELPAITMGRQ
jgi:hypothetical protein